MDTILCLFAHEKTLIYECSFDSLQKIYIQLSYSKWLYYNLTWTSSMFLTLGAFDPLQKVSSFVGKMETPSDAEKAKLSIYLRVLVWLQSSLCCHHQMSN
jgi:hypothetical protein